MRLTGGGRRSFSQHGHASVALQSHVRPSSHPSDLRATKQPFYGLRQLNDWDAMTDGKEDHVTVTSSPPHMRIS